MAFLATFNLLVKVLDVLVGMSSFFETSINLVVELMTPKSESTFHLIRFSISWMLRWESLVFWVFLPLCLFETFLIGEHFGLDGNFGLFLALTLLLLFVVFRPDGVKVVDVLADVDAPVVDVDVDVVVAKLVEDSVEAWLTDD